MLIIEKKTKEKKETTNKQTKKPLKPARDPMAP